MIQEHLLLLHPVLYPLVVAAGGDYSPPPAQLDPVSVLSV